MSFDGLAYTRESLAEELGLIERHATDGSAYLAGCSCIQEKHLLLIQGLAREGKTLATDDEEKEFYDKLGQAARELRKTIVDGEYKFPTNPFGGKTSKKEFQEEYERIRSAVRHPQVSYTECRERIEQECPSGDFQKCGINPAICHKSLEHQEVT